MELATRRGGYARVAWPQPVARPATTVTSNVSPDGVPRTRAALALFTDAEARAIWARAAQLQAEADDAGRRAMETTSSLDVADRTVSLAVSAPAGMFFGRDIVTAAQEAGIDAAHVAVALAEHEAVQHETAVVPSDAQRARFVRELGSDAGSMRAIGVVPGSRDAVMAQLREAFGRAPWLLTFDGAVGAAAGAGEVLRFRVPAWLDTSDAGRLATEPFVYHANRIGVGAMHVLLEPRGTPDQPAFEVTVTADLRFGQHFNTDFMRMLRVLMPVLLGVSGGVLAGFDGDAGSLLAGTAAFGAAAGAVAGVGLTALIRRIMHWEYGTARRALERGLQGMLRRVGEQIGPALPTPVDAAPPQPPGPRPPA